MTRAPTTNSSSSPSPSLHRVDDRAEGDRSTASLLANQHGETEEVKPNLGFINFGRDHRERAFLHANNVDQSLGRSIKNLPDVSTVEDKV